MSQATEAKILMIEDNKQHRFMYDFQFKQLGYKNFKAVATAQEGLESIKNDLPDLVLLDLILEGTLDLDGLEVLKKIKEDPSTANIPVIILSNKREKDMADEVKRLGAADYILKAKYLPREIVEHVHRFLGSHGFQS